MAQATFKLGGTVVISTDEPQGGALVTLHYQNFSITAKGEVMAYTLPVDMKVDVKVSYVDAAGNPATVDGDVTWETSDKEIANVSRVSPTDSSVAVVRPGGKLGQAQISATADADLGEGVRELITLMDVTVVAGEAVAGTIAPVGEPEPAKI